MSKKVLFVMTHLGSGWEALVENLHRDPSVEVFNTSRCYHHPDDVRLLTNEVHKRDNSAAIWGDVLFYNENFTMKRLMNSYMFVFWSCPFEAAMDELILKYKFTEEAAESYYNFRLEGLKQYKKRSPESSWNPSLEKNLIF